MEAELQYHSIFKKKYTPGRLLRKVSYRIVKCGDGCDPLSWPNPSMSRKLITCQQSASMPQNGLLKELLASISWPLIG